MGLLAACQLSGVVCREVEHSACLLPLYHLLCLGQVVVVAYDMNVGRGIERADELAAFLRVGEVDDGHGNLAHHLVGVYP